MRAFAPLFALCLLCGCQLAPVTAPPAQAPSPSPAPEAAPSAPPVFGAVTEFRLVDSERQLIFRLDEDPANKHYGLALSPYVTVGGETYIVHWDYADRVRELEVGQTVNLHPSDYATCVQATEGETPRCYRLMKLYRNDRKIDPITGF